MFFKYDCRIILDVELKKERFKKENERKKWKGKSNNVL